MTVLDVATHDPRRDGVRALPPAQSSSGTAVLIPPEGAPEKLRQAIAHGRRSVLARLTRAVRPALHGGDDNDAELTARVLSAISDEYARLVLSDAERFTPDRFLRHARWWLAGVVRGMTQATTRSRT